VRQLSRDLTVVVGEMTMDQQLSSGSRLQGLRVLAAEDEPMLLMALEDMLGDFGCHVVGSAATVAQALEMGTSKEFDVAILDVSLARETVDAAAHAIVARGIPIVLATGHVASDVAVRLGAASVVEKPYTPEALQKALVTAVFRV
jgi:CheY-like chemotaxis protein